MSEVVWGASASWPPGFWRPRCVVIWDRSEGGWGEGLR